MKQPAQIQWTLQVLQDGSSDNIIVAVPPKTGMEPTHKRKRSVLLELDADQTQNKRYRRLKYVLIPSPGHGATSTALSPPPPSSPSNDTCKPSHAPRSHNTEEWADDSPTELPKSTSGRARRTLNRPSYVEVMMKYADSSDEATSKTSAFPMRRHSRRKAADDDDSDFEAVSESSLEDGPLSDELALVSEHESDTSPDEPSDDDEAPQNRRKVTVNSNMDLGPSPRVVKSKGAGNSNMKRLLGKPRELDTSLPPLSGVSEIFLDITKKGLKFGLGPALEHLRHRPLKVATMCSGTESPLLALQMVQESLSSLGDRSLQIEHVFSAEIVPFKQAYIERNFSPPIVFRDVTEFLRAADTEDLQATTVYGSKVQIPTDIDIVVAGTSCVDYSGLNRHKKTINDGGESADTWYAVLAFCKAVKPPIVLFENVVSAEWNAMLAHYKEAGYETAGVIVDTKHYYLPATRQRGYMVGFDKTKLKGGVCTQWQTLMEKFRRPASSSVSSFLLPDAHIQDSRTRDDEGIRDVDWTKCELRHVNHRRNEMLGTARPFTHWQESGTMSVPEHSSRAWYQAQPDRIKDCVDCLILIKAREKYGGYDARFKTRVWDLSQNVDRLRDTGAFGITGCITPDGTPFLSDAGRAMLPEEMLRLQGLPLEKISLTTETPGEISDLAGNAMSSTVVGPSILAALIAGYRALSVETEAGKSVGPAKEVSFYRESKTVITLDSCAETKIYERTGENLEFSEILQTAAHASRLCICEGSDGLADVPIQRCSSCSHTACIRCAGNPEHNYRQQEEEVYRADPRSLAKSIRAKLPLRVSLTPGADSSNLFVELSTNSNLGTRYANAIKGAVNGVFTFTDLRRTHCWTATFQASNARLELVIASGEAEWRLFVQPDKTLAVNDPLRNLLMQPVAKAIASNHSMLAADWQWRAFKSATGEVEIRRGARVPSWWARIELPEYQHHQQPAELEIRASSNRSDGFDPCIIGTYRYLPLCGTACNSLYAKDATSDKPVYLFLDPSRTGDPKQDSFVFSHYHHRLEYDEVRPLIASLDPKWRPWSQGLKLDTSKIESVRWIASESTRLQLEPHALVFHCSRLDSLVCNSESCANLAHIMTCEVSGRSGSGEKVTQIVDGVSSTRKLADLSWIIEAMRQYVDDSDWYAVNRDSLAACASCAPSKPSLRWKLGSDGKTIVPYEDPKEALLYEQAIKARARSLALNITELDALPVSVTLGFNVRSLIHRAISRLPELSDNISVHWRLEFSRSQKARLPAFHLNSLKGIAMKDDYGLSVTLFPQQRLAVEWMRNQEAGEGQKFTLEEIEEALLPGVGLRAEVRAKMQVQARGGICADHPGFGKTLASLALVNAHLRDADGNAILADLRQRGDKYAPGLIATAATLIICPQTLVHQWADEIAEKLGWRENTVVVINTVNDLAKLKINDFSKARIIIVNRKIFSSESYTERLALFAGIPGPANNFGRAYTQWFQYARDQVPEHLQMLQQSGKQNLGAHIKRKYHELMHSEELQAVIPSKRLRGKAYTAAKENPKTASKTAPKGAPASLDTANIDRPLFEMFYFNRIVIDEFHQYESKELAAIKALRTDKRWGLSGTPALGDLYDVAQIAGLLGIPLRIGSDARGIMKIKNIREYRKDMTNFERFDAMRSTPTPAMQSRLHEIAQSFLDAFVRRNINSYQNLVCHEHLVPVQLELDHHAMYTELSQHLNSWDMRIRKQDRKKRTHREERQIDAFTDCDSAEEVLLKAAASYSRDSNDDDAIQGLQTLVERRRLELVALREKLSKAITEAQAKDTAALRSWEQNWIEGGELGDEHAIEDVRELLRAAPRKSGKTAKAADSSFIAQVSTLAQKLRTSHRSIRFLTNIQRIQRAERSTNETVACGDAECSQDQIMNDLAVSAFCGHIICKACFDKLHLHRCPANGCKADLHRYYLLWKRKMGNLRNPKHLPYGAKVDATMGILESVRKQGDQAILFVPYAGQLEPVAKALAERALPAAVLDDPARASTLISAFCKGPAASRPTVLVLNIADETAAGLNLQNANHVIFFSPLLRDTPYAYNATMAQAIGRVRRPGQTKPIHVYRIAALDTIDVDILEHRERRHDAIGEVGAPPLKPPGGGGWTPKLDLNGDWAKERTQVVCEDGRFSLRPQSWLIRRGAGGDADAGEKGDELLKVQGKSRVLGWEDFSSLVKFSRAYTEDD